MRSAYLYRAKNAAVSLVCGEQVVNQVLEGEGIGWLKLNRLKKLMEDESYRNFVVSKLNRTLDRKISPDDHIDDVVSRPPHVDIVVWGLGTGEC
jgi:hypothetical protein